jgi:hypothetical protein
MMREIYIGELRKIQYITHIQDVIDTRYQHGFAFSDKGKIWIQ